MFKREVRRKSGNFAKGRNAVAICQRTGFKYLQRDMLFEPGTGYYIHRDESDGRYNLVTDPLNFVSEKMKRPEALGLRYTSPDVPLSIGIMVSAEQLFLPSYASVSNHFIQFASAGNPPVSSGSGVSGGTSIGTGVSGGDSLDFSISTNSMYYVIVFPGI